MHLLLAAGTIPPFLTEVVVLLVAAAVVAYVCQRLGLVPIVGFLMTGVLIGPHALELVHDEALIEAVAEIGVLLLLFTIGIEFSLEKLAKIQRLIFGGGGIQAALTTGGVVAVLMLAGVSWQAAVFSGFLAALSSTAIVIKLLGDRGETGTPAGQAAVGLLIFQDLAIIAMVLLVPALAGQGGGLLDVIWALAKAGAIVGLVLVVARRLMPPLLEHVARTCSPELFLLTIIAVCLGTAYAVGLAGVSISLGAFLAGLVVSESRFSEHALSEILPLQILFSATFFVSVGLLFDAGALIDNLLLVLAVIGGVLVIKLLATLVAVRVVGRPIGVATATALLLAQVGEFSFVLERAGRDVGLTPLGMGETGSQAFIAATVVLMALTPVAAPFATRLGGRVERLGNDRPDHSPQNPPDTSHLGRLENHVIVAGYGRAARALTRILQGSGIPFVVTTLSPSGATEAEEAGMPVLRGDYAKRFILETVHLNRAKMLVIPDDTTQMAHRVTAVARALSPVVRIVACAPTREDAASLLNAGADHVVAADLESVVALFGEVLHGYQVAPDEILGHEQALRSGNYIRFERDPETDRPAVTCELSDSSFSTRTITIRDGSQAAGHSLAELSLDERHLHVIDLEHDGYTIHEPDGDAVLHAGDTAVIGGSPDAFEEAAPLFSSSAFSTPDLPEPPPRPPQHADWIDTDAPVHLTPNPDADCSHHDHIHPVSPGTQGCQECLEQGQRWVHLRICMECGHVGCCDSSPHKHASRHYHETGHPVMRSMEPGETWGWCFDDEVTL